MKKIITIAITFLVILPGVRLTAQEITFKVSAPPSIAVGTPFRVEYMLNSLKGVDFRLASNFSEYFEVLFEAPSVLESASMVNGKVSRTESWTMTLTLRAKKEGTCTIGPATIRIGNSEYKSDPFTINILPQSQAAQAQQQQSRGAQQQSRGGNAASTPIDINESAFIRLIVQKRSVYEQEGFLATFKIYSYHQPTDIRPKFPEFEGFTQQPIELNEFIPVPEDYNGLRYITYIVKQAILFPQRPGQLTIGSGDVQLTVRVPVQANTRSIFGGFFDMPRSVDIELKSDPTTIDVKPLPAGKPANFSSAVGSFKMTSKINRTEQKANESVSIELTVTGNGNIRYLKAPEVKFPNDFEVYDMKQGTPNTRITADGVSGTRTFEYMAIPRFAGDFEIPAVTFSYFDLPSKTYKTQSAGPWQLKVARDENSTDGPVVNFANRENVRFLGKDIRFLKTQNIKFLAYKDIFFGSFLYVMIYLMMTVLFIVFFIIYRKQMKENANIALVRTRKANKTAVKRLKQAEKLLHENKEEAFYEEVLRALWGYLSDKLNMPQSELTKENVTAELTKYGVDETLSSEFLEIIHTCEFARYAPIGASGAMDKLFGETINAIGTMESTIKK